MASQYVQAGEFLDYTPDDAVAALEVVVATDRAFVAPKAIAADTPGVLATRGVFQLPKSDADAWTFGQKLYWDGTDCTVDADDGEDPPVAYPPIGYAAAAAAEAAVEGLVLLGR